MVRILAAAAATVLAACAPAATVTGSLHAVERPTIRLPRGARAPFAPERFEAVFEGAVRAVRSHGYQIASCDPVFGLVTTAPVEVDAPCRGSTCLAREYASIKLGYRRARVTVTREVWDQTVREWRVPEDPVSLANMDREERALVDEAVRWPAGSSASRLSERCGTDPCGAGACIAAAPADR